MIVYWFAICVSSTSAIASYLLQFLRKHRPCLGAAKVEGVGAGALQWGSTVRMKSRINSN